MGTCEGGDGIETSKESEAMEDTDMTYLWRLLHPQGTARVSLELIPGAGRGLVASQDLEPGEVVLTDEVNFQIHLQRLVKLIIQHYRCSSQLPPSKVQPQNATGAS